MKTYVIWNGNFTDVSCSDIYRQLVKVCWKFPMKFHHVIVTISGDIPQMTKKINYVNTRYFGILMDQWLYAAIPI